MMSCQLARKSHHEQMNFLSQCFFLLSAAEARAIAKGEVELAKGARIVTHCHPCHVGTIFQKVQIRLAGCGLNSKSI